MTTASFENIVAKNGTRREAVAMAPASVVGAAEELDREQLCSMPVGSKNRILSTFKTSKRLFGTASTITFRSQAMQPLTAFLWHHRDPFDDRVQI